MRYVVYIPIVLGIDMKLLALILLLLWPFAAEAEFFVPTTCGPDAAPPQAAAAGYTCQTYRWGSGDTLSEIDTTVSGAPGFKLYPGTNALYQYASRFPDDYKMVNGQLVIRLANNAAPANIILSTCGDGGNGSWSVGQNFTGGYYWEVAVQFDASAGFDFSMGKPGAFALMVERDSGDPSIHNSYPNVELDNVDGCCGVGGWGEAFAWWTIGDQVAVRPNVGTWDGYLDVVETGHKRGVLVTNTAVTWWLDDLANGSVNTTPAEFATLYNQHSCPIIMGTKQFPMTVVSMKVWQRPPTSLPHPPPPPPPPSLSPDGSSILGGTGSLMTAAGTWTFGASTPAYPGYWVILLNGGWAQGGVANKLEVLNGGKLYHFGTDHRWYVWGSGGGWLVTSDPHPAPPPPPPSPDGSAISGGTGSLVTANGTWTFGISTPAYPGYWVILLNNQQAQGGVANKLEVLNGGKLYHFGTDHRWYFWAGGWVVTTDPH